MGYDMQDAAPAPAAVKTPAPAPAPADEEVAAAAAAEEHPAGHHSQLTLQHHNSMLKYQRPASATHQPTQPSVAEAGLAHSGSPAASASEDVLMVLSSSGNSRPGTPSSNAGQLFETLSPEQAEAMDTEQGMQACPKSAATPATAGMEENLEGNQGDVTHDTMMNSQEEQEQEEEGAATSIKVTPAGELPCPSPDPTAPPNACMQLGGLIPEQQQQQQQEDSELGEAAEGCSALVFQEDIPMDQPPPYQHPAGNRAYLEAEVVPTLRLGLLELMKAAEQHMLTLASGVEWEEGLYQPRGWRTFSPLRWLAQWLYATRPEAPAGQDPGLFAPSASLSECNRVEKLALIFSHLDQSQSGYLDVASIMEAAAQLRADLDSRDAAAATADMLRLNHTAGDAVRPQLFTDAMLELIQGVTDQQLDTAMHAIMGQALLRHCLSRSDKFAFLFMELDAQRCGQLPADMLVQLLQRAAPGRVEATLAAVGKQPSDQLSLAEFTAALSFLLEDVLDGPELDAAMSNLFSAKLGIPVATTFTPQQQPLDEVEPYKFVQLIRSLPTFKLVEQMSTTEVMDWVTGHGHALVLVDVRSVEEVAVSMIPGALHLPVRQDPSSPSGWALGDISPLLACLADDNNAADSRPAHAVVTYCDTGKRGGAAALLLRDKLQQPVLTLCGGIINYYNQGGRVQNPEGQEVQAVHPGSAGHRAFVTRPNKHKT